MTKINRQSKQESYASLTSSWRNSHTVYVFASRLMRKVISQVIPKAVLPIYDCILSELKNYPLFGH